MSRSRSCSRCVPEPGPRKQEKVEKLGQGLTSGNPRYPHLFVGNQAIYSDGEVQMIVAVEEDNCDHARDDFTLRALRILKNGTSSHQVDESFQVSQPAGDRRWKLHALL
ncbi:MAG: hypothetical protein AB1646_07870 [Thermodesulfobacteriota bacterium]